jgi:hypothetical protein
VTGNRQFSKTMRHAITVTAAVWSVLRPLSQADRDRTLSDALTRGRTTALRVQVRDPQGQALAPCSQARARQLVNRGRAHWVRQHPPVIRLDPFMPAGEAP